MIYQYVQYTKYHNSWLPNFVVQLKYSISDLITVCDDSLKHGA